MKTLTTTLAIAALALATVTASAQTPTVKLFLTENSNDSAQQHIPMIIGFDGNGDNALAYPDAGSAANIGSYNNEMFPFTKSSDDFEITSYDARPTLTTHVTIPFGILSKDTGNVKIYAILSGGPGYVWIENVNTAEHFSLLDTVKLDIVENTEFTANYVLHIGLPVSNIVTGETCYLANDGSLHVQGANTPGFIHELTLNGTTLYNSVVSGLDTNITGLAAGNYVSVVRINGIPVDSSDITIAGATPLIADFYADFNTIIEGDTVNFYDNSTNAYNYFWDFGDGNTEASAGGTMHQYTVVGSYQVTLTIEDENGCTASNFDFIQVDPSPTSVGGHGSGSIGSVGNGTPHLTSGIQSFRNTPRVTVSNSRLMVTLPEETVSTVTVVAANGTVVANEKQSDSVAQYQLPTAGVYIVTVVETDGTVNSTTIIAQ
jgi:PKD repeat protein